MGTSLLNIAVTGLNAAQGGLVTTSHNISNASTDGFNRQRTVQTTLTPQFTGAGFFGQGTAITTVERAYSKFLAGQVLSSQSRASELETYASEIQQIDNMLGDPSIGMSPAITGLFKAVNEVAANPSSIPARQSLLSSANALVGRFQEVDQRMTEIRDGVNSQLTNEVTTINALARQISDVNQRIIIAEAAGAGQQANDLHDQRDLLVSDLNKHIRADVLVQSDGSFSVFIGNGQPLVVGETALTLTANLATDDPSRTEVNLLSPTGTTIRVPQGMLSGGSLGGLLQFRSQTLDSAQNSLGRIAVGMAQIFNDQHRLGQDLTGVMGKDFFLEPAVVVNPDTRNLAPATPPGDIQVAVTDPNSLTNSDYSLTAVAGGYSLLRLSDNTVVFSGATLPITIEGMTIRANGVPATGASFKILPTRYAARDVAVSLTDVRNIAAGLPIKTADGIANTGTGKISPGELTTPVTLSYSAAASGYIGFPAGSTLSIWNSVTLTTTTVNVASAAQSVAISATDAVTVNGITFNIAGAPSNGDTFTIGPNQLAVGTDNVGAATVGPAGHIATTTLAYTLASNSLSGFPLGSVVSVTNGGTTTQYAIRLTNDTVPFISGASYQYNGSTFQITGAPANGDTFNIGMTLTTASAAALTGTAPPVFSASLPTTPVTLKYDKVTNLLTGFPPGSTVSVSANGTTTMVPITTPDVGVTFTSGMSVEINGARVNLTGSPQSGDTFSILPNPAGTADNRNMQLLGALQTARNMLGGTATFESTYAQLVSAIGNKAREVEVTHQAQQGLLDQAENARQSLSGVNLDEEAANLLRYQQAYQASAKMIDLSSKLFDLLVSLGR